MALPADKKTSHSVAILPKLFFCVVALPYAVGWCHNNNPMYYNGDRIENGNAGPWNVPWGLVCNAETRFFIFYCTGVMVSLRGRMGNMKKLGLAGCKARLSEAFHLAIAVGQRPNYWDLLPDKFEAANRDPRGGCPTWLTHPG